jgi:hypothetical protein
VRARINLRPAAGYLITSFGHTPSSFLLNRRRHRAYEPVTGRLVHPPFVHAQVGYVTIMAAFLLNTLRHGSHASIGRRIPAYLLPNRIAWGFN